MQRHEFSMKIGVFDSGVGGLSVALAIERALPEYEIVYREDREHVPYGTRTSEEILGFVVPIFADMIELGCSTIVVACNTVSTTIIGPLRKQFPDTVLIAMEPMIKPAAIRTRTGVIAVCATPATLTSQRYAELKRQFASGLTVLEPDCSDWAGMIENGEVNVRIIADRINRILDAHADMIVLGCTHYHWIQEEIRVLAEGRATVLQPEHAIVRQVKKLL